MHQIAPMSEDQQAIKAAVEKTLEPFDDEYWAKTDETGDWPEEFCDAMAKGGWMGIAFPEEYGHEPVMAHLGGDDGLDVVRRILAEATEHLNPGGGLLCEIGTGRDILVAEYPHLDFLWLDTEESQGEVFWITREQLLG